MLPGWRAESTPGGFVMISPWVATERRRTEIRKTATDPGEGHRRLLLPDGCRILMLQTLPNCPGGGGTSVGPLTDFGGVGRGGHSWGHSTFGVST